MKTRILLTIGDINGIGPEIILKALNNPAVSEKYDLTVVSPFHVLEYYSRLYNLRKIIGKFDVVDIGNNVKIQLGIVSRCSGAVSGLAVKTAIELCLSARYDAIVTAPISKKAFNMGGFTYPGHTEMLKELSNAKDVVMIMTGKKLRVGFASTHPPIKKVAGIINKNLLMNKLSLCYNSLVRDFNIHKPKIAVLSLNPHAGEGGQIGSEEKSFISPAIELFRNKNKNVIIEGPFPSDSFFANRSYTKYDLTFAMYHDQGMIPFKMIAGVNGVNYTAGLSFVRTSPDHGTAFDIAGKNLADEVSLIAAIKTADRIYKNRLKSKN